MTPRPVVVLTGGWCGERTLVRLLAAGGTVRSSGRVLARPQADPARHLRATLARGTVLDRAHLAVVVPNDLWLVNAVDAEAFVADLLADGIAVLTLVRASHEDRGLSRALCGPDAEELPVRLTHVDADEVVTYAGHAAMAAGWAGAVAPRAERITFEHDLVDAAARQATVDRIAEDLSIPNWPAPPERRPPTHDVLWSLVADPDALEAGLRAIRAATPTDASSSVKGSIDAR